ncbi:TPR-like protein [Mycena sanguinolenta]|uniref:TPR-like protein n=1 Tax=Mycena sanguinolenta TaxID=230812 RepID=A0A8H6ZGV8_9AGAR|nr:TPR-like protein [Mycena sanguinolenta]
MGIELVSEPTRQRCRARFQRRLRDVIGSFICRLQALWAWITRLDTPPSTPDLSSRAPLLLDSEKDWPVVDVYQTRAQLIDALRRRDAADAAFEAQVTALLGPVKQHLAELTRDRVSHRVEVSCHPGTVSHTTQGTQDTEPAALDLPPAPQIFYGRARELDTLANLLIQPRQVRIALLGEAGSGTSTLTLALLHRPDIAQAFVVLSTLAACPRRTLVVLDDAPDHDALLAALELMPFVSLLLTATHTPMEPVSVSSCSYTTIPIGPLPLSAAHALFRAIADLPGDTYDQLDDHNDDPLLVDAVPAVSAHVDLPTFGALTSSPASNSDAALVDSLLKRTRYLPREIVHLAQRAQYEPLPFLLASLVEEGESAV